MTALYRYIVVTDSGMAPCIDNGLITLATCKPGIRAHAHRGDWVAGFAPVSSKPERAAYPGRLVYLGRVQAKVDVGSYEKEFPDRSDAVYKELISAKDMEIDNPWQVRSGIRIFIRKRPDYHSKQEDYMKDLSAGVIYFDQSASWYFGNKPVLLPDEFRPCFASGRGYRVNGASEAEIDRLVAWVKEGSQPGVYNWPRDEARKLTLLASFRSVFAGSPNALGRWIRSDGSNFPYFNYSKQALKLLRIIDKDWVMREFDWSRWAETREGQELLNNLNALDNATILDMQQIADQRSAQRAFL